VPVATVRIEHVWKRYGAVEAVKDLTLVCDDGEFIALLGPSGCGKTSTLRMVAGLEAVSEGGVFIGDRRVNDVPPRGRDIAMVFEDYALYPHMRVYDNIAFPLRIRGMPRALIEERVGRALAMLGLETLRNEDVQRLSGGAQQRVSIGRAIVRDPQVLLMDEPISHLDSTHKLQLRGELKRLQRSLGVTTLYVTHDQVEAMVLADRVAVMNHGRLQQLGPPRQLYEHPANLFVAGFIGEPPMNLLPADLTEHGRRLRGPDLDLPLPPRFHDALGRQGSPRLTLGIRPADLRLDPSPLVDAPRGEVYSVQPRGDSAVLALRTATGLLLAEGPAHADLAVGDVVGLGIPPDRIHLFDAEDGGNVLGAAA
jgi:ABC-type sugar transport system ATPase subunit